MTREGNSQANICAGTAHVYNPVDKDNVLFDHLQMSLCKITLIHPVPGITSEGQRLQQHGATHDSMMHLCQRTCQNIVIIYSLLTVANKQRLSCRFVRLAGSLQADKRRDNLFLTAAAVAAGLVFLF